VAINLSKEEIKEKYDDKLESEMEGPLYDVLSKLFKNLAKVSILIPGEFKSAKDDTAIKCSVKASDGHLYPLKSSIVFIHKPVHYIKHAQIKYVEFSRIGGLGAGMPSSRSFDMTVHKVTGEAVTFAGIDKQEHKNLAAYFKAKNIRTRNVDADNKQRDSESEEEEEASEEVSTKRRAAKKGGAAAAEDYDDEEDDESFKDEGSEEGGGSGEGGDDEEMEEEGDDDEDMEDDLDDGIDNDELKAL